MRVRVRCYARACTLVCARVCVGMRARPTRALAAQVDRPSLRQHALLVCARVCACGRFMHACARVHGATYALAAQADWPSLQQADIYKYIYI